MFCLFFAMPAFAALEVPRGTLQPIPENSAPSYNQNVNSEGGFYSQNQKLGQEQIIPPAPKPGEEPIPQVPIAAPIAPSTEPILLYWLLLIGGSLGLIAAMGWVYWRFRN